MRSRKGFIQVPIVVLLSVGIIAILATSYYFVRAKNDKQAEADRVITLNTNVVEHKDAVIQNEPEKVEAEKVVVKVQEVQKVNAPAQQSSSNTQKSNDLAKTVISDIAQSQLDDQISSLNTLLGAIRTTKKNYIAYAKSSAQIRADLLNDFANTVSDSGIKSFARSRATEFANHGQNAQSDYDKLYEPLETEISNNLGMVSDIREVIKQGNSPANLPKLVSIGNEDMDRFLGLATKINSISQDKEQREADSLSQSLKYLDSLIAGSNIAASTGQQLLQIEQQVQQAPAPKKAIQCWSTTKYSGGIINGTSQTSIRCE